MTSMLKVLCLSTTIGRGHILFGKNVLHVCVKWGFVLVTYKEWISMPRTKG